MDRLGKDILSIIALELNYPNILNLCKTSKILNKNICENNDFWRNKFYKDYPFLKGKYSDDFRKLYKYIENERKVILENTKILKDNYNRPSFVEDDIITFIKNTDFGYISGYHINYLINPLIENKIFSRPILGKLLTIYLIKNNLFKYENEKISFNLDDHIQNYLEKYIIKMENDNEFNRTSFGYKKINTLMNLGIIIRKNISDEEKSKLKEYSNVISKINTIIKVHLDNMKLSII